MIEVRMRDQHVIHGRQVAELHAGPAQALENEEPASEIGINDEVAAADLHKESGMADESEPKLITRGEQRLMELAGAGSERGVADDAPELPHLAANRDVEHGRQLIDSLAGVSDSFSHRCADVLDLKLALVSNHRLVSGEERECGLRFWDWESWGGQWPRT